MKRTISALLAAVLSLATFGSAAPPERCDPSKILCSGLVAAYKFEEGSDYARLDHLSGAPVFNECDGNNMGNTMGKSGLGLLATTTSKGVGARFGGGALGSGPWSLVFWLYPTSNATTPLITTRDNVNKKGVLVSLLWEASILKPYFAAYENETLTLREAKIATATTLSTWHMLVVSVSRTLTGTARIGISRDGGAFTYTAITQNVRPSQLDLLVAGGDTSDYDRGIFASSCAGGAKVPANTTIDEMLFYGRALTADEVSSLYNGGVGRFFPSF